MCSGRVPLDPRLTQCTEDGKSFVEAFHNAPAQKAMTDIVQKLLVSCSDSSSSSSSSKNDNVSSECTSDSKITT